MAAVADEERARHLAAIMYAEPGNGHAAHAASKVVGAAAPMVARAC